MGLASCRLSVLAPPSERIAAWSSAAETPSTEMRGRYAGDTREICGRYTGDVREMYGRCVGDVREV